MAVPFSVKQVSGEGEIFYVCVKKKQILIVYRITVKICIARFGGLCACRMNVAHYKNDYDRTLLLRI